MAFRGRPAPGHEKGREEVAVGDALVSGTPVRIRGRDRCPGAPSPAPLQFRAGLRLCGEKSGSRRTGKGKSGGGVTDGADADLGKSRRRRRSSAPAPPNLPSPAPSESSSVPAPISASSPGSPSLPLPALQQHRKCRFSGARGRSAKHEPAPEFSECPLSDASASGFSPVAPGPRVVRPNPGPCRSFSIGPHIPGGDPDSKAAEMINSRKHFILFS